MLPTMPLKRKVRTDALAQMQDTGAIKQAVTPAPEAPKAPTLGRPYRPAPITGKVQGALPAAPQAPQRMAFGGQPQPQAPMAPRTDVLAGLAGGLEDAKPTAPRVTGGDIYGNAPSVDKIDPNTDRGPVTGAVRGGDPISTTVGGTKPPPLTPEEQAQADRDNLDQQIRDFVSGRVSGANDVDTTEQEALIRDLVEGKTGAALVDARARGGRAGFGASGAQMAIEGDIRKQAGQAASGDILDLRRTEQQRAFDNATQAIQTESGMRSAASDDALRRMYLEALQAEADLEDGAGGSAGDAINGGVDAALGAVGAETDKPSTANAGGNKAPSIENGMDPANAIPVTSPPSGATQTSTPGVWYSATTRKYYKVNA